MKAVSRDCKFSKKERNCFYELHWARSTETLQCALARKMNRGTSSRKHESRAVEKDWRSSSTSWRDRAKRSLEACWNWGLTHDRLEEIEGIEEVMEFRLDQIVQDARE